MWFACREIVRLKVGDIDSAQMIIRNVQYPQIPCEMKNDWRHNVAALGACNGETRLLLCQWSKRADVTAKELRGNRRSSSYCCLSCR